MPWAILDSDIYIGHWVHGSYEEDLKQVSKAFIVRHSAVVLSELRRGARTPTARKLVDSLYLIARVQWEPTAGDWWEAGKLVRRIGDTEHWEINKRREFQNDTLIALTARNHGATIVTSNGGDFRLLSGELGVRVLALD
jgi:predicted nucleic acid-binding protein